MRRSCTLALAAIALVFGQTLIHSEGNVKKLSKANLGKAREFIMHKARPLEQALYRYRFEGGSAEAVRAALQGYQNPDGGFGKGLEPDMRAPESSVLATIRALQALSALKTPADHPMIRRAMAYLGSTFDEKTGVWRIIPTTAAAHPHAPWWNQETLEQAFGAFLIFPRAEVLGYMLAFGSPSFPSERMTSVLDALLNVVEEAPQPVPAPGVESCARLFETGQVPAKYKEPLYQKLVAAIPKAVEQDPAKWNQYCMKPVWLVRTPESPFLNVIKESVYGNLDYEIDNQSADGSWQPNWSWYGAYPETWPTAQKEWSGILTIQTLETLQAFGRIAE